MTGSGKTYTMFGGTADGQKDKSPLQPITMKNINNGAEGIVWMTLSRLFQEIRTQETTTKTKVLLSFFEIYN